MLHTDAVLLLTTSTLRANANGSVTVLRCDAYLPTGGLPAYSLASYPDNKAKLRLDWSAGTTIKIRYTIIGIQLFNIALSVQIRLLHRSSGWERFGLRTSVLV